MFSCVFVTFPFGVLGLVWYLFASIPDCYFVNRLRHNLRHVNVTFSLKIVITCKCAMISLFMQ